MRGTDDDSDKRLLELKSAIDQVLNSKRSVHAPCNNAYKDSRDGYVQCSCWRCRPDDYGPTARAMP